MKNNRGEVVKTIFEDSFFDCLRQDKYFCNMVIDDFLKYRQGFPLSLLHIDELSNLESIVKYLREIKKLSYKEIGVFLNRNPSSLAVTYRNSKLKMPKKIVVDNYDDIIPFSIFDNNLSVLESIVFYFSNHGKKQIEIARLLRKDPRTIWTIIHRIKHKLKLKNHHSRL